MIGNVIPFSCDTSYFGEQKRKIARLTHGLKPVGFVSLFGQTVYAHVNDGGEEVSFESDGDYVVGYVKLPVIGKPCRTQKDVETLISEMVKFLERHQSF